MPMNEAHTILHTYTGPVENDRQGGRLRAAAIQETFADEGWPELFSAYPYESPTATIDGNRVEIRIGATPVTLKGAVYYRRDAINFPRASLCVIFLSGSSRPARVYGEALVDNYLGNDFCQFVRCVLVVDYRGFGRSRDPARNARAGYEPGPDYMPGEQGLYTDARAMIDFLLECTHQNMPFRRARLEEIVLHGYSLGSGPATEMATRHPKLAGLILHGPMYSAAFMANQAVPIVGGIVGDRYIGFNNAGKIETVGCPILITCGPNDERMSVGASKLYDLIDGAVRPRYATYVRHDGTHEQTGAIFQAAGSNPRQGLLAFIREECLRERRG